MLNIASSTIGAGPRIAPRTMPLDATVIVAHASPLIRAGIVSTLKRLPRCVVRVWERGPLCTSGKVRRPHVLIGDEARLSQMLAQRTEPGTSNSPRIVLMTGDDESTGMSPAPYGVDRKLSIGCAEEELCDAVRRLTDAGPHEACTGASRRASRGGLAPGALRRVREHIEEHLGERIGLADLAEVAGLSECHFSRAFKQSVGVPPHCYVMQRRIERATVLVETTDRPFGEIAHEVGFADQSHFTRMFGDAVGDTPRAFRQRCR